MKKVFVNMVFAFCFALMFGTKAYAQTPQQIPLTVLSNKTWTINLNKEVSATKENLEKHIYVYQEDNKKRVPLKISVDPVDKKKIYVSPKTEYESNRYFTLVVSKGLLGVNGNVLKKDYTKRFRALNIFSVGKIIGNSGVCEGVTVSLNSGDFNVRVSFYDGDIRKSETVPTVWDLEEISLSKPGFYSAKGKLMNYDPREPLFTGEFTWTVRE